MGELDSLLELQRLDQRHDELLAHRRSLQTERERLQGRLDDERAALDAQREAVESLERDCRLKTLEVDQLDEQIRTYQHRLDVDIMSYKEMESLREQIVHQRHRMSELEDEALQMMDTIEAQRVELEAAEAAFSERSADLTASMDGAEERVDEANAQIEANAAARAQLAEEIPAHLLRRYDELHRAHHDPIAPIRAGSCTGCSLKLSAGTVERARSGQEIVACENCSRLLYIP